MTPQNRNFTTVFDVQRPFRAKGLRWTKSNRNFTTVFDVQRPFCAKKGCGGPSKIAILPRFWTSNVHFVQKGCVSWLSGGTAPALKREIERRARERERERERGSADVKVRRCRSADLKV